MRDAWLSAASHCRLFSIITYSVACKFNGSVFQGNEVDAEASSAPSYKIGKEIENEKNRAEKRLASAFANNALADVVQDFEKTLERSRPKSTSVERDSLPYDRVDDDSRPTPRERFFMDYGKDYQWKSFRICSVLHKLIFSCRFTPEARSTSTQWQRHEPSDEGVGLR